MAEERVISQALVLQNGHEKMLEKLRNMQLNNLTAKQQKKLSEHRKAFGRQFTKLSYSFFGLSADQLKGLDTDELKALDELISQKALPWKICQMLFTFGVPIIGWIGGSQIGFYGLDGEFHSWLYLHHRRHLIKAYGKDFLQQLGAF